MFFVDYIVYKTKCDVLLSGRIVYRVKETFSMRRTQGCLLNTGASVVDGLRKDRSALEMCGLQLALVGGGVHKTI